MIVTIDGPAGAGKSSVSRRLAETLGFEFLDTGAMYRAVALKGLRAQIDWDDPQRLSQLARQIRLEMHGSRVMMDGVDVSQEIRTREVTQVTRHAANNLGVRQHLVDLQRQIAAGKDIVTEGRDQGTVVFPQAGCKIYLTASPEERARRRWLEMTDRGQVAHLEEILEQQTRRDREDCTREVGPLRKAADAIEVVTDGLTEDEVLEKLVTLVQRRQHA